jgi:autotransporter strand-loop-strand O-heptosyltransferase
MNVIHHSHLFIGLSSGLSWLAWAMNKKVVMISNFTEANHEFDCIRITKTDVCHGCWNKAEYRFDAGDWNWCPVHKGTDRQWECHKEIKAADVILSILSHI